MSVDRLEHDDRSRLVALATDAGLETQVIRARVAVVSKSGPLWIDTPDDIAWIAVDLTTGPTNPEWRHERRNYSGR